MLFPPSLISGAQWKKRAPPRPAAVKRIVVPPLPGVAHCSLPASIRQSNRSRSHHDEGHALGRHLGRRLPAPAEGVRLQQPHPADESARQYRRRHAAGAGVERLWHPAARDRRRACRHARRRARRRAGLGRALTFGGEPLRHDRRRRARGQRPGRARRAAAGRPGGQRSICPARSRPSFQITGRYARQTNYISPPGDFAAAARHAGRQASPTTGSSSAASTCWRRRRPAASSRSATR